MEQREFSVGDRVVTNKPLFGVLVGTVGTVVKGFITMPGCYDVLFDGFSMSRLVYAADLDLARAVGSDNAMKKRQM